MVALTAGVNMLVGTIAPINAAVQTQLGVAVSDGLSDITFTAEYGGTVGLAMFFGLVIHLLIARFTPVKTIFLTGHMLWWFPFVIVAGGVEGGLTGIPLLILGRFYLLVTGPSCHGSCVNMWDATGDDSFLIGHPTGILSLVSGFVAKRSETRKSTEDLKVPENRFSVKYDYWRVSDVLMNIVIGLIAPVLVPEGGNLVMLLMLA